MNYICNYCDNAISGTRKLDSILVHGAKEHNLKHICFEIPKNKLIVLAGPSGSGKSSIATDVLQKECLRQFLESLGMTTDHLEKPKVDLIIGLSPSIGVSQRVTDFNPRSTVGIKTGIFTILRNMFAAIGYQPCIACGKKVKQTLQDKNKLTVIETEEETKNFSSKKKKKTYFNCPHCNHLLEKLTMGHFSSNTTTGACKACKGIGEVIDVNFTNVLNEEKTITNNGVNFWDKATAKYYENVIQAASKHYNFTFNSDLPIKEYTKQQKDFLLYGITFPDFVKTYKDIKAPKKVSEGNFEGISSYLLHLYKKDPTNTMNNIQKYIMHKSCIDCKDRKSVV